jgi:hypothetical protein
MSLHLEIALIKNALLNYAHPCNFQSQNTVVHILIPHLLR